MFNLKDCDSGAPEPEVDVSDLAIAQDGEPVSLVEETTGRAHRAYVTLLLDLSGAGDQNRQAVVDGAKRFVGRLLENRSPGNTFVGVRIFDGSESTASWQLPIDEVGKLESALDALVDDFEPDKPEETNLYGAVGSTVEKLRERMRSVRERNAGGLLATGHLVTFSANADSVGARSAGDVGELLREAATFSPDAPAAPTVRSRVVALRSENEDLDALEELFGQGTPILDTDAGGLGEAFAEAADGVADRIASIHVTSFCSSARSDQHTVEIDAPGEASEPASIPFEGDGFEDGCSAEYIADACDGLGCGGVLCGGCDDASQVCRGDDGVCVDFCRAGDQCREGSVENELGYTVECGLPESFATCGGDCVDTASNTSHCGNCDHRCPEGVGCAQGSCACEGEAIACGGTCLDPSSHDEHCGECGNSCEVRCADSSCIRATGVAAGPNHSCAVREDSRAECWGSDEYGQLGDGNPGGTRGAPEPVEALDAVSDVYVGTRHTCALTADGAACWGSNGFSQLGTDAATVESVPVELQADTIEDTIAELALGESHTCARTASGYVYCWGSNAHGQVGPGAASTRVSTPQEVSLPAGEATEIEAGANHTCAVVESSDDGGDSLYCWGLNDFGQLGHGETEDSGTPQKVSGLGDVGDVGTGRSHTCAALQSGSVHCWGRTESGRLGVDTSFESSSQAEPLEIGALSSAVAIASAGKTTCATDSSGVYHCWGDNSRGQLGDGPETVRTPASFDEFGNYTSVALGSSHVCGLNPEGLVACRGGNDAQQLGEGSSTDRNSFVEVVWH